MYIIAIAIVGFIVFMWALSIASFQGLDLRKRSDWLYVAVSFICGLVLSTGISNNFIESLIIGAVFAFAVLLTGVVMRQRNHKYGRLAAKSLVQKHRKEDPPSLLAKLVRILFDKYK